MFLKCLRFVNIFFYFMGSFLAVPHSLHYQKPGFAQFRVYRTPYLASSTSSLNKT